MNTICQNAPPIEHLKLQKELIDAFLLKLEKAKDDSHNPKSIYQSIIEKIKKTNASVLVDRLKVKNSKDVKDLVANVWFSWSNGCYLLKAEAIAQTANFCSFLDKWGISFSDNFEFKKVTDDVWRTFFYAMNDRKAYAICSEETNN